MAYKKLDVRIFKNTAKHKEIITDLAGNTFLTRTAVARLFGCSLPTLATTYKRKGLPLRGNLKPRASGVFGFCGNIRCGINCFMPQGFEARSVV